MVKSVLIYGADTWSLYEDDKKRINATEIDAFNDQQASLNKVEKRRNISEKNGRTRYNIG
jgi:hypothetical protein